MQAAHHCPVATNTPTLTHAHTQTAGSHISMYLYSPPYLEEALVLFLAPSAALHVAGDELLRGLLRLSVLLDLPQRTRAHHDRDV